MSKETLSVDKRGRITIPKDIKEHLGLREEDDIWIEKTSDGKIIMGRVEVQKRIID